jgi:hypothetical protein
MSHIAGHYTATFNSQALGQPEKGFELIFNEEAEEIIGSNFGKAYQDDVFQGVNLFLETTLLEYNAAAAKSLFWPWDTDLLNCGVVGRLGSSMANALILTAVAGTPAASTPASLTLTKVKLAQGYPVRLLFDSALRKVPLRLRAQPQADGVERNFGSTT